MTSTFHDQLTLIASRVPDGLALVHGDAQWTWSELARDVDRVAAGLLARGIGRGDKVAIWLANVPEWPLTWLAAASLGAAVVPLNTRYKPDEAAYVLAQSESKLLLVPGSLLGIDFRSMLTELLGEDVWESARARVASVSSARFPRLTGVVRVDGGKDFALRVASPNRAELAKARGAVQASDDVILVYTSGTTGFPKGARHSHATLSDVQSMADLMGVTHEDRLLAHMPFFHVGGAFLSIVTAILTGCSMICLEVFTAETALAAIAAHECTVINGVPTHFVMMLGELEKRGARVSSARIGWIAGAMIPPEVVTGIRQHFGMTLVTMYGMTETTGVITSTRPDDPLDVLLNTVGRRISDDYEVQVTNPATGVAMPPDEQGEIWVRGHRVTSGYYKMPEETAASLLPDGWFRTGDLGRMREDGRLRITGRLKDMYIVGGTNTYPAEIENVIFQLPAVAQAYVIGVPDERMGEVGMAFVQVKEGQTLSTDEVIAHCKAKLANYKVPRFVELVSTFPMTASGKIQKYKMRDSAIARLNLEEVAKRRLLDYRS